MSIVRLRPISAFQLSLNLLYTENKTRLTVPTSSQNSYLSTSRKRQSQFTQIACSIANWHPSSKVNMPLISLHLKTGFLERVGSMWPYERQSMDPQKKRIKSSLIRITILVVNPNLSWNALQCHHHKHWKTAKQSMLRFNSHHLLVTKSSKHHRKCRKTYELCRRQVWFWWILTQFHST